MGPCGGEAAREPNLQGSQVPTARTKDAGPRHEVTFAVLCRTGTFSWAAGTVSKQLRLPRPQPPASRCSVGTDAQWEPGTGSHSR